MITWYRHYNDVLEGTLRYPNFEPSNHTLKLFSGVRIK